MNPREWTTKQLFRYVALEIESSSLHDIGALKEFARRYLPVIVNVSYLLKGNLVSYQEDFRSWVLGWIISKGRIKYFVELALSLDTELPEISQHSAVCGYIYKTLKKTAISHYCDEIKLSISLDELMDKSQGGGGTRHIDALEDDSEPSDSCDTMEQEEDQKPQEEIDLGSGDADDLEKQAIDKIDLPYLPDADFGTIHRKDLMSLFSVSTSHWPPRRRIVFLMKVLGKDCLSFFSSDDLNWLVQVSCKDEETMERAILDEHLRNPSRAVYPLSADFIASMTGLTPANVDAIYSRAKKELRCNPLIREFFDI